ncbi:MAG: type I restriction-modification system subunit M, partial [Ruminococcaceae bacterium]|nr:type I restriction-modification system subunit M [Oscillospiraceae bacterium]
MNDIQQKQLGATLWSIADKLRGAMNPDDFRDYMLSFLFLRYLSDNYEEAAKKELGSDYTKCEEEIQTKNLDNSNSIERYIAELKSIIQNYVKGLPVYKLSLNEGETDGEIINKARTNLIDQWEQMLSSKKVTPLIVWYIKNLDQVTVFEKQMKRKIHFVIRPNYLWSNIYELAKTQSEFLLKTLQDGFKHIENESFGKNFKGLFSEINLDSEKLGKSYLDRNDLLCSIIMEIAKGLSEFPNDSDLLGDAYEY